MPLPSKERMRIIMDKWEEEKRSMDDVIGYIIRKSNEDSESNSIARRIRPLNYRDVKATMIYLNEYFAD